MSRVPSPGVTSAEPARPASPMAARFVEIIRLLVPGEVVSYGDIADDAGFHGRARAVGHTLATTDEDLPWWRVVNSVGRLAPGKEAEQAACLRAEGVTVVGRRVVAAAAGRFSAAARPSASVTGPTSSPGSRRRPS